jgi:radical SAM-linked protein
LIRLWQRALQRARIPLAYSEGFSPHPRISVAAPLAIGVTGEAELMDIVLRKWVSPHFFAQAVGRTLPPGIEVCQVHLIAPNQPSLQSQVRYAEYTVSIETEQEPAEIESAMTSLMAMAELPWQHWRDTGPRNYDLRALICELWLDDCQHPHCTIGMKLRCDSNGSGRPEQVMLALGFAQPPQSIHRRRLILGRS